VKERPPSDAPEPDPPGDGDFDFVPRRRSARETLPASPKPSAPPPAGPSSEDEPEAGQHAADWELFLLRLRYREGRVVAASGNKPVLLHDPELAWVVFSGYVEVFAVRVEDGQPVGPRRHLFRASAGEALFGMDLRGAQLGLLAIGATDTQLLRTRRTALARLVETPEFAPLIGRLVESWVKGLSASLAGDFPPRQFEVLEAGQARALSRSGVVRSRGCVLWVRHEEGHSRYVGRADLPALGGDAAIPLSPRAWLEASGPARLAASDTQAALKEHVAWVALERLHALALAALAADAQREALLEQERLAEKARLDQARLESAYSRLTAVLAPRSRAWTEVDARDPLLAACQLVGNALGIAIKPPRAAPGAAAPKDPLRAIASASRVRARRVALRATWWKGESGPLLAYREADRRPVALLPAPGGGYALLDPVERTQQRVTAPVAATLDPFAVTFYRPFEDGALTGRDLIAFGLRGCARDVARIVLVGAAIGALGMLAPIVTGVLFDLAIPGAQRSLLLQLGVGLLVAAVAAALFELTRAMAVLRLSGKMSAAIETAIMDRLLELPTTFFRRYTAGDLAQRALGIQVVRETLSGVLVSTVLSGMFSLFSFALLFVYDARLALVACGLVLLLLIVLAATTYLQVRCQRTIAALAGQVAGTTLQLINGVAKFRVAGAEDRAFAYWAGRFAGQRRVGYRARMVSDGLAVFNAAYPVLTSLVVFGVVAMSLEPRPTAGTFLAFNAAFGQFVAAAVGLSTAFMAVLAVVPTYERTRPIIQTPAEVDASKADPGELSGAIGVDAVSFRYTADGPLVLDQVSLAFRPGEFVALVGPSGSGKSTLLRLLLGFETPAAGAILYDGRDLATLDLRAVRRQIGTVLQGGRLLAGDIFTNIVGATGLSLDEAWDAARMAGLDEDIRAMPMGMHTVIGEGGSTLSGGQRQRLLIARAIASRPRMVLFDEATSALDNRTQEIVSRSLERLAATRVVIAHRLSTIVNADRINVLQHGRVVETGTYRELMRQRGVFAQLARRQIT
jgi:ATP-binding cassette subfamily C protein